MACAHARIVVGPNTEMNRPKKMDHLCRSKECFPPFLVAFLLLACGCATTEQSASDEPDGHARAQFAGMSRGGMGGMGRGGMTVGMGAGGMMGGMGAGTGRGSMMGGGRGQMRGGRGRQVADEERNGENVWVDRDIQYGLLDDRSLTMDIIQPKMPNKPPLPAIVYLNPTAGPPTGSARQLVRLAASGNYVCAKVRCHSFVEVSQPTNNPECAQAVQWLAAKATEFDINPGRVGVWVAFPEADFVCTLERGSTNVLASSVLERGERDMSAWPPMMTNEALAFFDKNLRGEDPKPPPTPRRGRGGRGGGGRGRMF